MHLPRRQFIRTGLLSAFSAGFALSAVRAGFAQTQTNITSPAQLPQEAQKEAVFLFKADTFKPYINGIFTAPNARGEKIELKLLNVDVFKNNNALEYTNNVGRTESFSMTFKADSELPPFTSIHKMDHPALGQFYLFLTKRKSDNGDILYDAVINHLL
jgi:hypothetical protein